jgi:hypothetical protein
MSLSNVKEMQMSRNGLALDLIIGGNYGVIFHLAYRQNFAQSEDTPCTLRLNFELLSDYVKYVLKYRSRNMSLAASDQELLRSSGLSLKFGCIAY